MEKAAAQKPFNFRMQIAVGIAVAVCVLLVALFAFYRLEQFLIRDSRFVVTAAENGDASPISIHGVKRASLREIESQFAGDVGKSLYQLPLADRRDTLRSINWVRDASISRIWPNQVEVRIEEREPVAFVVLGASHVALIDQDGVVMQRVNAEFNLPVLKGIKVGDPIPVRREKVQRMLRLTREIGDAAAQISEVDTSERDNLRVTQSYEGRGITLELGDRNYGLRYRNFVNHIAEIRKKLPRASTLDLRLENKITAVDD